MSQYPTVTVLKQLRDKRTTYDGGEEFLVILQTFQTGKRPLKEERAQQRGKDFKKKHRKFISIADVCFPLPRSIT